MRNLLHPYSEQIYTAMRVIVAFLFASHGAQKYFGVLGGAVQIHTLKGAVAGTIELIGGTLIALGLFTSIAAFIASGEMAVAYFWVHAHRGFWPILNHGELPVGALIPGPLREPVRHQPARGALGVKGAA